MKLDVFCGHTDGIPASSAYQRYIQLPHHPACPRGGFFFASALLVAPASKASGHQRKKEGVPSSIPLSVNVEA